ncbi:MAG: hypothetical protein M3N28_09535 [Actinomycetota bacterium]|nr:hypothetical protein [Actinomycetota bacterium]
MGWCHEFGVTVRDQCGHPMRAGEAACQCPQCGVLCEGQFNGCATVWAAGPREVALVRPDAQAAKPRSTTNGDLAAPANEGPGSAPNGVEPVAQPFGAGRRRSWSDPPDPVEQPEPVAEPAPIVTAADERRGQVFEWLRDSFEGVNSQLRVLSDNLSRQQHVLAGMIDAQEAAGRLSQLADALPERIGAAVQEAVNAGQHSVEAGPDQRRPFMASPGHRPVEPDGDRRYAADAVVVDLRQSAHPAKQGPPTSVQAEQPVDEPSVTGISVPEPGASEPSATEPVASDEVGLESRASTTTDQGLRTQLGSLASSVQTRINRSGWQEKLRSLSSR